MLKISTRLSYFLLLPSPIPHMFFPSSPPPSFFSCPLSLPPSYPPSPLLPSLPSFLPSPPSFLHSFLAVQYTHTHTQRVCFIKHRPIKDPVGGQQASVSLPSPTGVMLPCKNIANCNHYAIFGRFSFIINQS